MALRWYKLSLLIASFRIVLLCILLALIYKTCVLMRFSFKILRQTVVCVNGHRFHSACIKKWIQYKQQSPFSALAHARSAETTILSNECRTSTKSWTTNGSSVHTCAFGPPLHASGLADTNSCELMSTAFLSSHAKKPPATSDHIRWRAASSHLVQTSPSNPAYCCRPRMQSVYNAFGRVCLSVCLSVYSSSSCLLSKASSILLAYREDLQNI